MWSEQGQILLKVKYNIIIINHKIFLVSNVSGLLNSEFMLTII